MKVGETVMGILLIGGFVFALFVAGPARDEEKAHLKKQIKDKDFAIEILRAERAKLQDSLYYTHLYYRIYWRPIPGLRKPPQNTPYLPQKGA